jgi:hypothetical protein
MVDLPRRGVQQQRAAGNRLTVLIGFRQSREQAPPVVDQGDHARHEPGTFEVADRLFNLPTSRHEKLMQF